MVLLCTNRYITSCIVVLLFNKIFLCIYLTVFFLTLPFPKIISTSRIVSHVPPPSAVITTDITLIFYRVISSFIPNVSWLYFVGFFVPLVFNFIQFWARHFINLNYQFLLIFKFQIWFSWCFCLPQAKYDVS